MVFIGPRAVQFFNFLVPGAIQILKISAVLVRCGPKISGAWLPMHRLCMSVRITRLEIKFKFLFGFWFWKLFIQFVIFFGIWLCFWAFLKFQRFIAVFCAKDFIINLSPNPLQIYSANIKDSENADRWLAPLSSFIVH